MAWSIAAAQRGEPPRFELRREPSNSYTTRAQQWFIEQLLLLEDDTADGGGYAHKEGYHDTVQHNDARSGVAKDYSARDAVDRNGPRDKTRARDWTFYPAQRGDYSRFQGVYGRRLEAAYRANDPRLNGWREALGRTPSYGRIGLDFRYHYTRSVSASHDWHWHFSEDTFRVENFANKWAMLTILAGWSLAEWQQSLEDDVLTDEDKTWLKAEMRTAVTLGTYDWAHIGRSRQDYRGISYEAVVGPLINNMNAAVVAPAIAQVTAALAAMDAVDEVALAEALAPAVAQAVVAKLPPDSDDVSVDELVEAFRRAVAGP